MERKVIQLEKQHMKHISVFNPEAALEQINDILIELQCPSAPAHKIKLCKIADVTDPRFEDRQWGHQCEDCKVIFEPETYRRKKTT